MSRWWYCRCAKRGMRKVMQNIVPPWPVPLCLVRQHFQFQRVLMTNWLWRNLKEADKCQQKENNKVKELHIHLVLLYKTNIGTLTGTQVCTLNWRSPAVSVERQGGKAALRKPSASAFNGSHQVPRLHTSYLLSTHDFTDSHHGASVCVPAEMEIPSLILSSVPTHRLNEAAPRRDKLAKFECYALHYIPSGCTNEVWTKADVFDVLRSLHVCNNKTTYLTIPRDPPRQNAYKLHMEHRSDITFWLDE